MLVIEMVDYPDGVDVQKGRTGFLRRDMQERHPSHLLGSGSSALPRYHLPFRSQRG
jgi:hypothetical protein